MKPYMINAVYNDEKSHKIYYSNIDIEYRKKLKTLIDKKQAHLYCACRYPEVQLELGIKENYQIYPLAHHYEHADNCPKSERCIENNKYNSAFKRMDDNENEIFANVNLNFGKKEREADVQTSICTPKAPRVINAKMTVSALIKKLNMITFQDMAFSKNVKEYPSIEEFCRWVNWKSNHIYVKKGKTLRGLSIEDDKKKFFYGIFNNLKKNSKQYTEVNLTQYKSCKNDKTEEYEIKAYPLRLSWKQENFDMAREEFRKTYNGMTISSAQEKGHDIVCAGFYNRNAKGFNTCLDIHFILVNKNGLFSESTYEAKMYDHICDYLNKNNLKSKYAFYKPWEFGTSIYKNDYLEDGILYNKNTDEEMYIEVFGMNTPEYLETKTHKELMAGDKLIAWDAANNEELPDLDEKIEK